MEKVARKIYEDMPETLTLAVPPGLQHRWAELIILPLDEIENVEPLEKEIHNVAQMQISFPQVADPDILKFFGCMPDLSEREPQGEYALREDLL
ncbi:MAG: hypothetical protein HY231_00810 [Acidobacteria bacterium]|nr:hypothetical protein [Acidobacteriota bacterium]